MGSRSQRTNIVFNVPYVVFIVFFVAVIFVKQLVKVLLKRKYTKTYDEVRVNESKKKVIFEI